MLQPGAAFSFDWHLSGNRAVAPLQVFDDGRRVWLQFAPGQPLPAIFARTAAGDQPISPAIEGAYAVLPAYWPEIILRGGHLVAYVRRRQHAPEAPLAHTATATNASGPIADIDGGAPMLRRSDGASPTAAALTVNQAPAAGPASLGPGSAGTVRDNAPSAAVSPEAVPSVAFRVTPDDRNFRLALVRWAGLAGWTFRPEHWAVEVDIPITGSASFDAEFKSAVRDLIATTEMAERPLQPCFYANQVLRIVAYAQPCDRAAAKGAQS